MTVPTFSPPHPMAKLRYLKQAARDYVASGNAAGADIPTIAGQPAASPMNVNGTVYTSQGVPRPASVTTAIMQGGVAKGTQTAAVNQSTGAFTSTIPGGSAVAGSATVRVQGTSPVFTTSSAAFTLT